ncbi:MAG: hypothetical protein JWR25_1230 [Noviherbaspirillum sp.]|nr:hypothetical protein [Noviherbaspirillum sp.]
MHTAGPVPADFRNRRDGLSHLLLHLLFDSKTIMAPHKNKTLATLLSAVLGGLGAHRFYLYGKKDKWAWVHIFFFPLSVYAGLIEALVLGLTPDEKWDALHNPASGRQSRSGWGLAILLVATVGFGAIAFIATLARIVDIAYTGGAYG